MFQCFVCGDWPWKYSLLHRSLQNQDGTKMGSNTGPWRNWCLFSQPPQSLQRIELDDKSTDLVSASMCKGFHGGSAGKENSCPIWKGQVTCLFSRRTKNDINTSISQKKMQPVYLLVNRNKGTKSKEIFLPLPEIQWNMKELRKVTSLSQGSFMVSSLEFSISCSLEDWQ